MCWELRADHGHAHCPTGLSPNGANGSIIRPCGRDGYFVSAFFVLLPGCHPPCLIPLPLSVAELGFRVPRLMFSHLCLGGGVFDGPPFVMGRSADPRSGCLWSVVSGGRRSVCGPAAATAALRVRSNNAVCRQIAAGGWEAGGDRFDGGPSGRRGPASCSGHRPAAHGPGLHQQSRHQAGTEAAELALISCSSVPCRAQPILSAARLSFSSRKPVEGCAGRSGVCDVIETFSQLNELIARACAVTGRPSSHPIWSNRF